MDPVGHVYTVYTPCTHRVHVDGLHKCDVLGLSWTGTLEINSNVKLFMVLTN